MATPPRWSARPETVAAALLDYYDLGITLLSARGYDIYDDAIDFGRYVIPLVRDEVAKRDAAAAAAARRRGSDRRNRRHWLSRDLAGPPTDRSTRTGLPTTSESISMTITATTELHDAWTRWHAAREADLADRTRLAQPHRIPLVAATPQRLWTACPAVVGR